ncbi:hypothetical protein [Nocardia alba]|uniref:hypothetical protein n=1 Tax=Nocardia alba TaxID=225051 RepID=UPI0008364625|nr:hypothetical protein [Nocardia alba]
MIAWFAQQPAGTATVEWKDFGPFAAGLGTLLAAFVAGWFLSRNSRKTPYDRLEQLSKARAEWPEELEGRGSLDRSIEYALARIRSLEGPAIHVHLTMEARRANQKVANDHLGEAMGGLLFLVASAAMVLLVVWARPMIGDDPVYAVKVVTVTSVGLIMFGLYGLFRTAWHGWQWWRWRRQWRPSDPR